MTADYAYRLSRYPDGPVERIRFPEDVGLAEAMGLAVASIPNSRYIGLTQPGDLLKRAFKDIRVPPGVSVLVNKSILKA